MPNTKKSLLLEAKKDLELGVVKALCHAKLRPTELSELLVVSEADLMRDHGCDLYMAEKVKQHAKQEQYRLRAQNQYTPADETGGLYPLKPYTRTNPINETHDAGRMLDHGNVVSDAREGRMARGALRNIAVDSYRLHQLLNDEDDLPQWCEYKIAQAKMMMNSVREYLEYKLERQGEDLPGEAEVFAQLGEEDFHGS
tara:strand:- start:2710 stop:3303 length:594 start_codon:yes stop_codon:yes gene_type:complete